ncbi:MAG: hypothetical protein ACMUIE_07360 [Thermoplasmatota archaeon]
MRTVHLVVGIVILTIALGGGITSLVLGLGMRKDPSENCVCSISSSGQKLSLKGGTYDIWVQDGLDGDIKIRTSSDSTLKIEKPMVKENFKDLRKYGTFKIGDTDEVDPFFGLILETYTIHYSMSGSPKVYITEPIHMFESNLLVYGGSIVGTLLIVIGSFLTYRGIKGQKKKRTIIDTRTNEEIEYELLYGKKDGDL